MQSAGPLRDSSLRDTGPRDTGLRDTGLRNTGLHETNVDVRQHPRDTPKHSSRTARMLLVSLLISTAIAAPMSFFIHPAASAIGFAVMCAVVFEIQYLRSL